MNNCPIIAQNKKNAENYLDVAWGKDITRTFEVKLRIVAVNRHGVLARIAAAIAKTESNIDDVDMESEKDYTAMSFVLQVRNRYHLAQVIRNLRRIKEVARITRI
jgi:GTP pyrophosphokinase